MAKRRGNRRASKSMPKKAGFKPTSPKVDRVVRKLVLFFSIFVVSLILFRITTNAFWNDLFFLLMLVTGFVSLALLIVWLILMWLKAIEK